MTKRASDRTTDLWVWSVEPGLKTVNIFWAFFELRRTFELCEAVVQSLQSTKASALVPMECTNVLKDCTMALPEDDIVEEMVHKGPPS